MFIFQLLVRSSLRNDGSRPTYRLLGYLSVIQLSITLLLTTYQVSYQLATQLQIQLRLVICIRISDACCGAARYKNSCAIWVAGMVQ